MTANQAEACHTEAHIPAGAGSLAGAGILLAADTTWLAWLVDR